MAQRATHWPAAVSDRSRALLAAPPAPAHVLTAVTSALYLSVESVEGVDGPARVLPLVARGGLRLPTAVTLAFEVPRESWGVEAGSSVVVGAGEVRLPGVVVRAVRTWSPPRIPSPDLGIAGDALAALATVPESDLRDLARAVVADLADGTDPSVRVRALVGAGPGLTPSGDDALCGTLLALRLLGPRARPLHERLWAAVEGRLTSTTSLSASLLAEAAEGYAVPPLARLCAALVAGDEQEATALVGTVAAIGHSSGRDLLAGLAGGLEAQLVRSLR